MEMSVVGVAVVAVAALIQSKALHDRKTCHEHASPYPSKYRGHCNTTVRPLWISWALLSSIVRVIMSMLTTSTATLTLSHHQLAVTLRNSWCRGWGASILSWFDKREERERERKKI